MTLPDFRCRNCNSPDFVAVGKSRLGAKFFACAGCTAVFMDPTQWSKARHEQLTPGLGHLSPTAQRARSR